MYSQPICATDPGCVLFLLDQSFSMAEPFAGTRKVRVEVAVDAVNRHLADLLGWCCGGETRPAPCFEVGVLGYTTGRDGRPAVGPLLQGALAGRDLVSVTELHDHPLERVGTGDAVGAPVWVRAPAQTALLGTPTAAALRYCRRVAQEWAARHPNSFPPAVFHLTDGEATDASPEPAAAELRAVATRDGNLLLHCCCLSGSAAEPILLPADERALPDDWARLLFRTASRLPAPAREFFAARGEPALPGARCLTVNADASYLLALYNPHEVVLTLDADEATAAEAVSVASPTAARQAYRPPRCPACDRKAPGPPGARYCMVCGRTF